jgi:hypothetical protein
MTVSNYLAQTPLYTAQHWVSEMESLIKASSRTAGSFPFSREAPLPENTNLVTGDRRYDLNAQCLELHAASTGIDRTLWLFAADAEILGLELRDGQKPLPVFANIIEPDHTTRLEAHLSYLLDQFTPESISRLYEYAGPASINREDVNTRRRYMFAKMAVFNIANYDSGVPDKSARLSTMKHIRENSDPHNPAFEDARNAYRYYSSRGRPEVFNALRTYYIRQVSGNPLDSQHDREHLSRAGLLTDIPQTLKSMFHARIFVKRLEQADFFLDYSRSNPPKAAFIQQDEPGRIPSRSPSPERTRR